MRVPQNLWDTLFFMHVMDITLSLQVSGGWKASYRGLKLENFPFKKPSTTIINGIFSYG